MSGQASLRRWYLKWVLCSDQILLLSSELNSDYLPVKDPLINIFFLSTILDCFSAASWHLPRQFQFFQQITLQMFHQPRQNKAVPHRWASFSLPFSPPPRFCNTNWCHQGIDFPSWEVPACAHVAASGRVYWKITKGTQGDRTRLAPRPQGHEAASSRSPGERWWPWGWRLPKLANSMPRAKLAVWCLGYLSLWAFRAPSTLLVVNAGPPWPRDAFSSLLTPSSLPPLTHQFKFTVPRFRR